MTFTGSLSEFSLPEIFQFLEQGQKKGLLTIRTLPAAQHQKVQPYYIWLLQGRIVAASDRLDDQGLISMISQRGFVSEEVTSSIPSVCLSKPLGLCLKSQGLLQAEQITLLFRTQVLKQVSALLQVKEGEFEFDPTASLPQAELTGLSMPATEVTFMGLRTLQDWTALAEKLPDPTVGLMSTSKGQPEVKLDTFESRVLELANGTVSLRKIAERLELSVEKVQQIAFRLIITSLAEEIFLIAVAPNTMLAESTVVEDKLSKPMVKPLITPNASQPLVVENTRKENNLSKPTIESPKKPIVEAAKKPNVSKSFLQNLVGFLHAKA